MLQRFIGEQEGATATEYGLITALIAVFAMGGVYATSAALQATFIAWSSNM